MRNTLLFSLLLAAFSCHAQQPLSENAMLANSTAGAKKPAFVQWDKKMIELGAVKKGDKRSMLFEFTNNTAQDIQIDIVDACFCTETEFPRGPIAPGATGKIEAVFNSEEKEKSETIDIRVIFKQKEADGNPHIEVIQYHFDLEI